MKISFMFSIKRYFYLVFFASVCSTYSFSKGASAKYTAIFAHGLGGQAFQGELYRDLIGCHITGENGPEWDSYVYGVENVGPQKSCLAQDADIAVVRKQIENLQENIILLGLSKGAAVILNTVGWLAAHDSNYLDKIKAVILDSPFASPEKVAANIAGEHSCKCIESSIDSFVVRPVVKKLTTHFYPNYNSNGITPIKAVKDMWSKVDKNMVVVFIHSKVDKLISINNSRLLYMELKKLDFINLYLIEASAGEHGNACWGPDRDDILSKLCLIYLKHNLPLPQLTEEYVKSQRSFYAEQSQKLLSEIQPSVEEVNQRIYPRRSIVSCCLF